MNITWCTDIHLDSVHDLAKEKFFDLVRQQLTKFVLIGGDISIGQSIVRHLKQISEALPDKEICFVLGNHDYYNSSFVETESNVKNLVKSGTHSNLKWLDNSGPIKLTEKTALVGSSLWADWLNGDVQGTNVWLNDYELIEELQQVSYHKNIHHLRDLLAKIAKTYTDGLLYNMKEAFENYDNVVCLTHVPPFWSASFHAGKIQNPNFAPHFTCQQAGNEILYFMRKQPDKNLLILCGHTHGVGEKQLESNIYVKNGGAIYGKPSPQPTITVT